MSEFPDCKIVGLLDSELKPGLASPFVFQPPKLDAFCRDEERQAWVRQSYERFIEKVREHDAWQGLAELN